MDINFKEYKEPIEPEDEPMEMDAMPKAVWGGEPGGYLRRRRGAASVVVVGYAHKNYTWTSGKKSPGACPNAEICKQEVRYIQRGDIFLGHPDVKYNFMVCADGMTYEGRGWSKEPRLPAKYKDMASKAIYIGYVGDYSKQRAPESMKREMDRMVAVGVKQGHIAPQFVQVDLADPWLKDNDNSKVDNYMSSIYTA